jgi:hypothetical protein
MEGHISGHLQSRETYRVFYVALGHAIAQQNQARLLIDGANEV